MEEPTTRSRDAKGQFRRWLEDRRWRFGEWAFAASDARARREGLQVAIERGGLARSYRDPRYARFARCSDCGGSGRTEPGGVCPPCEGTGRVTIPAGLGGRDG